MPAEQFWGFRKRFALLVHVLLLGACLAGPQTTVTPTSQIPTMALNPSPTAAMPTSRIPTIVLNPPATVALPTSTSVPTATPEPSATPDPNQPLQGAALVEALRQGGYVIYFRHATTDGSQSDTDTQYLRDCSAQRNLNEQGRAEARAIGQSFFSLNIPIGQVWSSQYCRARDTALLAFGQAETTPDLTVFPDELREERIAALRQMLSTPPEPGKNTVLVTDEFNLTDTAGITTEEGEAAIFAPLGEDGFKLIARVLPEEWIKLERLMFGSLQVGFGSDSQLLLPDLETLLPSNIGMRVHSVTETKLLRFTNSIQNNGPGAMEIWGYSDPSNQKTIVVQHIYGQDDSFQNVVVGEFIFHPEHDHWHVGDFARYELWSLHADGALDSVVAVSAKVSYCLRDDALSEIPGAPRFQTYMGCNQERQGITAGWIDVYKYYLAGQNIDVTDVPNGIYALRSIVDPDNQFWDLNRGNNAAIVYVEIVDDSVDVLDITEILSK